MTDKRVRLASRFQVRKPNGAVDTVNVLVHEVLRRGEVSYQWSEVTRSMRTAVGVSVVADPSGNLTLTSTGESLSRL